MTVTLAAGGAELQGDLTVPGDARGLVVFAHGSGSGRHSPRNRFVAEVLQRAGLATLLMDLLTEAEEAEDLRTRALRSATAPKAISRRDPSRPSATSAGRSGGAASTTSRAKFTPAARSGCKRTGRRASRPCAP